MPSSTHRRSRPIDIASLRHRIAAYEERLWAEVEEDEDDEDLRQDAELLTELTEALGPAVDLLEARDPQSALAAAFDALNRWCDR